ncbi:MAG: aminoglycoside phosphotransferase family protein [Saprospiraceae bacterium]|nr:aminoglycoside phosphotransferase family protein [Saprospiraceae bacterium]
MQMNHQEHTRLFIPFDRWLSAAPYGDGHINDTFRVEVEHGGAVKAYLLQRINRHVFRNPERLMRNMQTVCEWLAEQEGYTYRVVAPLAGPDGRVLHTDDAGEYWRLFPFVEHSYTPEAPVGPETAAEAARAYGAFARALRDFPAGELVETIPGFHDTDLRWQHFMEVLEKDPAGRKALTIREIDAIREAKPLFDRISALKKSGALPLRVAHNDTKASNILFDRRTHKAVAVIDLDTVMPGTALSDFGDMVRTFTTDRPEDDPADPVLRRDVLEALKAGYLEEAGDFLHASERAQLLHGAAWITGEQAMRFLGDWLAGDVYYKTRYAEHNLVRARNQLALFRELSKLI